MRIFKRAIDIIFSIILLVIFLPVICLCSILVMIESPGSPLFKQQRVGLGGRLFTIYKLRTMKIDKQAEFNPDRSKDHLRILKVGRFLRRCKLDELPQLYNILKGDMSFVGPRPTIKEDTDKYDEYQKQRLLVRPGLTGLAQISGNASIPWEERIHYDVHYIQNWSLKLEFKIIVLTLLVIILGEEKFKKYPKKRDIGREISK